MIINICIVLFYENEVELFFDEESLTKTDHDDKESFIYFMKKSLILLDYIHKKGIVHRNIKSNTLVNTEGGFGFMDFILKDFYYSCFYDDDDDATNCSLNNININVFFKKLYDKE